MEIGIVTIILTATLMLLISEKLPMDITAIGIMAVLTLTGILTPPQAVSGFANPAVITVGAMFLISRAMIRTGVVGYIGQRVIDASRGRGRLALIATLIIVAIASAFINNTPVVVLFIPVILSMGCRFRISPSKYLIPLSYVSILAGTSTLIGTSTNIIVSDLAASYGHAPLTMFELSKVGVPIAVVGFILILLMGPKLMPDMLNPTCEMDDQRERLYLAELAIPADSRLVGLSPCRDLPEKYPAIETIELIRNGHVFHPCRDPVLIAPDDLILVKGSPNGLVEMINDKVVELPLSEQALNFGSPQESLVVELIIPPNSDLLNQRLGETDLFRNEELHIIAVERSGLHYTEKQIPDIHLKVGDILLAWCRADKLDAFRGRSDWIVVEDVQHNIVHKKKAPLTGAIFAGLMIAASTGLADIMVCALVAVFALIITGCLPLKEAYRALQANVLMLIVGTIALGAAMDKTGASQLYAEFLLGFLDGWSPTLILGGIILLTSISTQVLSNNATAVLLLPIALSTATGLGVDPRPFIIGVCIGASACFATPIGYQTNLLVYGPGGYRFTDYLKLGLPLNFMVIVAGIWLIPIFWPF